MIIGTLGVVSYEEDGPETMTDTVETSVPTGKLTVRRQGTFVASEFAPSTAGSVQVGTDNDSESFIRLSEDFMTAVATGTVTVFLSTTENFVTDPANGNPDLD